jgi:hypothetical protein
MRRFPWTAILIGLFLSIVFMAVPLSAARGEQQYCPVSVSSQTRWPTVTRRPTDTRWPTATRVPALTRQPTETLLAGTTRQPTATPRPGTGRRPTDTRWPTIVRRPTDTRWPSPTPRSTATRWPTVTRGSIATRPTTPTWTAIPSPTMVAATSTQPASGEWLRYYNSAYNFEFYYPADASIAAQDDGFVQIYFAVAPGTNLVEKYLELHVSAASQACPSLYAGTPAGTVIVNGASLQIGTGSDAGAGQLREYTTYSTQQDNACFGLTFILHSGNIDAFPAGTPEFDKAAESALFPMILNTFRLVTSTATSMPTPTPTVTPSSTSTPTPTVRPSSTPSPTFDFPKVTIKVGIGSCRFGPSVAYLHAEDVLLGDTGVVWGRAANSTWLYVKMDKWTVPCWVAPSLVTVDGNILRVAIQPVRLPITNALYGPPQNVRSVRQGDQVVVTWDKVWRTADDDRGYFLDVYVCQNGIYTWVPIGLDTQDQTTYTFSDTGTCSLPSSGQIYTVEKHGYTSPVNIPWPPK